MHADANPTGGSVSHGSATFSSSGSTFNINQSSANAVINWQSFNIGAGETVNFNQPSATSVTWNQINDPNPSQILGSLNANGYVVLQNSAGFFVGGQASLTAHGLIMTTASTPAFNLCGGGPWSFNAPPPTAKIINYGQINITGGGSAYLIANDIENNGTISAPGGKIGLYAGEQVLVSTSPDGRGLSAEATVPQGLVDNNGNLIASAGSIALQAQMVNQNGLIQANSAQNVNGSIELIGGDSVNLGANSTISAQGESQGISSGGSVTIQAGNTFSDLSGSTINVEGGAQGGNAGQVEMSAPVMGAINSVIDGQAMAGFTGGTLTIDPNYVWLDSVNSAPSSYTFVNINNYSGMSQITVQANNDITLNTLWSLANQSSAASLSLSSAGSITLNNNSGISAGKNWTVNLTTGSGGLNLGASPVISADYLNLTIPSINSASGIVNFQALDNIGVNSSLTLPAFGSLATLTLASGNTITLNNGSGISAGKNWTLNLNTGSGGLNFGTSSLIAADYLNLTIPLINSATGNANFQALDNIVLKSALTLPQFGSAAALSLTAGNDITLNPGSDINAGSGWGVDLAAGAAYSGTTVPGHNSDGIYLNGNAYIQTQNGNINLWAANEVQVGWSGNFAGAGELNAGTGSIFTKNGGSISVTALLGDVNTGASQNGFSQYTKTAPYDTVSSLLGGISTANGGNVNINAGGNVISFAAATVATPTGSNPRTGQDDPDPGVGCFGAAPGNLTINAGDNVYGCYIVMNGLGTINALNIGTSGGNVALSLATGGWNLNAANDIYLQEVRNPNGVFNSTSISSTSSSPSAANHLFTYNPQAFLSLNAANAVNITGLGLSRPQEGVAPNGVPLILPPIVNINAGPGGVVLDSPTAFDQNGNSVSLSDYYITLFPSAYQSLDITTTGGGWLSSDNADGSPATLLMSDSGYSQWFQTASGSSPFGLDDHATVPLELNNDNPVKINLTGSQLVDGVPVFASMDNIILQTDKATHINVDGDMISCSFYGENLHQNDVTSINVGGQIYSPGSFTSITLPQGFPSLPGVDTPLASDFATLFPGGGVSLNSWYLALALVVDPGKIVYPTSGSLAGESLTEMLNAIKPALAQFASLNIDSIVYNPNTKTLTAIGPLASDLFNALESPTLQVIRFDANGFPVLDANGHPILDTINWTPVNSANASSIATLNTESQNSKALNSPAGAYVVGGAGQFNVTAGSIILGNSYGILSVGDGAPLGLDYSYLAPYFSSAANVNVTAGYLEMPASTIACLASGGSVNVTANGQIPNSALNDNGIGVSMDLGSQELLPFEAQIMDFKNVALGIYTTGGGNVDVQALGTINIDSSRVATFDGGNINVESLTGDINAGSGGTVPVPVNYYAPNYLGGIVETVPANGIIAATLTAGNPIPPGAVLLPGNITVDAKEGSIFANIGGVSQIAYDEILTPSSGSASITLNAGSPGYIDNLNLGNSGVIGIDVNATASGNINGLIIAQQNANINSAGSFAGTVFSGGVTSIASGGGISGTIVAVGGLNASGSSLTASVFTTSVNGGAGTLATTATASSSSQSAANQTTVQAQQQLAGNSGDDNNKKKKKEELRTVGRVTVILANAH